MLWYDYRCYVYICVLVSCSVMWYLSPLVLLLLLEIPLCYDPSIYSVNSRDTSVELNF